MRIPPTRLADIDHLKEFDQFNLLMIEQPLWHDDFYYHAAIAERTQTEICLDEAIRNARDAASGDRSWAHAASSTSRSDAWADSAKPSKCMTSASEQIFRYGAEECWSPASDARTTWRSPRCLISDCRGRVGVKALLERRHHRAGGDSVEKGTIKSLTQQAEASPSAKSCIEKLTVRKETLRSIPKYKKGTSLDVPLVFYESKG